MLNPTAKSIDVIDNLTHALESHAGVLKLTQGRIQVSHALDFDGDYPKLEEATAIIDLRGGSEAHSSPVSNPIIHLYAYADTSRTAYKLYDEMKDAVNRRALKGRLDASGEHCNKVCLYPMERGRAVAGWNKVVCAWYVRGTYNVEAVGF